MKPYDLIYEILSIVLSLDGERVQSNFVAEDICANFNEILLQSAISSTYLRKSFVKEKVVFKTKKKTSRKRKLQRIPRFTKRLKFWYFWKTIDEQSNISNNFQYVLCVFRKFENTTARTIRRDNSSRTIRRKVYYYKFSRKSRFLSALFFSSKPLPCKQFFINTVSI